MTPQENPPRDENEVEVFEGAPVDTEAAKKVALERDHDEKMFTHIDTDARIQQDLNEMGSIRQSISSSLEKYKDTRSPEEMQTPPEELRIPKREESNFKRNLKRIMMAFGVAGAMAGTAQASPSEKNPSDSLRDVPTSVKFENARLVNAVPEGYTVVEKDGKTFAYKVMSSKKAAEKPRASGATVSTLKKSTGPRKAITPHKAQNESVDVIYLEKVGTPKEKEVDPYAAFSVMGEQLFDSRQHAVADIYYPVRQSNDINAEGMFNTSAEDILIKFKNDFGATGEAIIIPAAEKDEYLTASSTSFKSQEAYDKLKAKAAALTQSKTKLKELGPDFTQKDNTVGLPGSSIAGR